MVKSVYSNQEGHHMGSRLVPTKFFDIPMPLELSFALAAAI